MAATERIIEELRCATASFCPRIQARGSVLGERGLLASMDVSSVVGLRDRALITVPTYTFARVGAAAALNVKDQNSQKIRRWLHLREKNSKVNEMPCDHKLENCLDDYVGAAGVANDRKGPLFRVAVGETRKLGLVGGPPPCFRCLG